MGYNWRPSSSHATTTASLLVATPRTAPRAAGAPTVAKLSDEFIEAAEDGRALNRSGRRYRPSALRDLRGCLRYHVAPALGDMAMRDVRRRHVQALVDRLVADDLSESRIRSVISALRALYGYAIEHGYVDFSPADGLVMTCNDEPAPTEYDEAEAWEERPAIRSRRSPPDDSALRARKVSPPERDGRGYQPIALLPERILSLALRAVFVLFVVIVLLSLTQSA
jgi:hypothetical protein